MSGDFVSGFHCISSAHATRSTCLPGGCPGGGAAVLVPEVCPGRPAPRDGAVTALQLEEDGDRLVRVGVEVEHGGAAAQELWRKRKET